MIKDKTIYEKCSMYDNLLVSRFNMYAESLYGKGTDIHSINYDEVYDVLDLCREDALFEYAEKKQDELLDNSGWDWDMYHNEGPYCEFLEFMCIL